MGEADMGYRLQTDDDDQPENEKVTWPHGSAQHEASRRDGYSWLFGPASALRVPAATRGEFP